MKTSKITFFIIILLIVYLLSSICYFVSRESFIDNQVMLDMSQDGKMDIASLLSDDKNKEILQTYSTGSPKNVIHSLQNRNGAGYNGPYVYNLGTFISNEIIKKSKNVQL